MTVVGGLVGGLWHRREPQEFTSTTAVLLAPISTYIDLDPSNGAPPQVSIDTDAQIAISDRVVNRITKTTGESAEDTRAAMSLAAPPLSTVLRLSYTASSPLDAAFGASAWAEALLAERARVLAASVASYRSVLEDQVSRIRSVLALGELDPATTTTINDQVGRLETALQRLDRQVPSPGRLLTAAPLPKGSDPSDPEVQVTSGALIGLLIGLGLTARRRRSAPRPNAGPSKGGLPYRRESLVRDALRHRRPTIAVAVLLGIVAGVALTALVAERQEATAALALRPLPGNAYGQDPRRDQTEAMQNEAQSVRSDDVLTAAAAMVGGNQTVSNLQQSIRVVVPPRTTTVQITYSGADRASAAENAESVLLAFMEYRERRARDNIDVRLEGLTRQINFASGQLERALSRVSTGTPNQQSYHGLLAVSSSLRLSDLELERMRVASLSTSAGRAAPPTVGEAHGLSPITFGGAGLMVGLCVGLAAAVWRERRFDRVRRLQDIEHNGITVLASEESRAKASAWNRDDFARRASGALLRRWGSPVRLAVVPASPEVADVELARLLTNGLLQLGHGAVLVDPSQAGPPAPSDASVIVDCGVPGAMDPAVFSSVEHIVGLVVLDETTHAELEALRNFASAHGRQLHGVVVMSTTHVAAEPDPAVPAALTSSMLQEQP
jgi:hypothetical protein